MTSSRPYQWPIILSIVLHASILVAGMVMADLLVETERTKPASTSINITMNASEPALEEKPEPQPKQERESKPEQEPVLETVSVNKPEPLIEEKPVPEQKVQEIQRDEAPKMPSPEPQQVLEQEPPQEQIQQEAPKQVFSKEALVIQDEVIGQQLPEQTSNAEAQYQDQILSLIESNKFYPKRAKKMRQEGDVSVAFTLNRDGSIQDLKVLDESAPSLLKRAALKAIRLSALFPPFPSDFNQSTRTFETKLSYRLF